jgi:hypothetical protein
LPQGCSKKIDVNLLLADLAFQVGYPRARGCELRIGCRLHHRMACRGGRNRCLAWPAATA